ncbi:MAG: T9SS type A sorting domain-containing protein [Bacteroidetes bacterium]|nr:T9SS type A sorting domain-containing protein [Bacteroidota bacterium]
MKHPKFLIYLFLLICSNSVKAQISTFPYLEYFISSANGWTTTTVSGSSWELGVPTASGSFGSYSQPICWGTDLDSGYRANSWAHLTSPKFYVSSLTNPYFSFYQFRHMASGLDGLHVEYSTDDIAWNLLGAFNSPFASNWYNASSIFSTGLPAFTGNSTTWVKSSIDLSYLGSLDSIRFRFVFRSNINFGSAQAGIFLDDFNVQELPTPPIDVGIWGIVSPKQVVNSNVSYPITFNVANNSSVTIDTIYCHYSVNGVQAPTVALPASILPFQSGSYTIGNYSFPTGTYNLCGYVTATNDANPNNESFCMDVSAIPIETIPYSQDFENGNGNWAQSSWDTLTRWQYGTPNFGLTVGAHSGNNCWDVNLNSGYFSSANSVLYSPMFTLTGTTINKLSFWLNHNSEATWDGTRLEYSVDNDSSWFLLGILNDPNVQNWYNVSFLNSSSLPGWASTSNEWQKSTYKLYPLQGYSSVRFRFIFTSDPAVNTDGISMDDFTIEPIPDYEAELVSISTPSNAYMFGAVTDPITFLVKNNGSLNLTNFTYQYSVNGVLQSSSTNFGSLAPGGTVQITLPGFTMTQLNSIVCGKVILLNDADTTNNNACMNLIGITTYTPSWTDNFDNGNTGWHIENVSGTATNWELGAPNFGQTNSALSAPFAWDINLNTAYTNNAHCRLYSPFFDFSAAVHPKIEFWQNLNSENNWDGFRLEYKSGIDTNWYVLGTVNDSNALNWYTDAALNSSNLPAWEGSSLGWQQSIYNLDFINLSNVAQFRFVFTSDKSAITDGVSIDNFSVSTIYTNDALLNSFVSPGPFVIQGSSTPIEVSLKNNGSLPITSLTIKYVLNGGAPVTYSWSGNLLTDSVTIVSLSPIFPAAGNNTLTAYIEWASDLYNGNDTISTAMFGLVSSGLPYFNDFENGPGGWLPNQSSLTNWEYGMPSFAPLNTSYSGNACWDINLNSPYFNLSNAILTSPIFDIFPYNIITIQFWLNYSSESGADGMYIEYSNNGTLWQRLGSVSDPAGTNWYNGILSSGNQGWSGISNGWQSCSYVYNSPPGNSYLQLRYRFISDFNVVDAGCSIDDISITGVTSVNELDDNSNVIVYPNPANDELFILLVDNASPLEKIELRSIDGKIVYSQESLSSKQVKLSTASYEAGIYLLGLMNKNGESRFKRIVIQH